MTKKLAIIMMSIVLWTLMASCGSRVGTSEEEISCNPDKLMDEIVAAGRAGNDDRVRELREMLYGEKMTLEQAYRYIFEIEPKAMLLNYEGGSWNEEATIFDYLDIPCPCDEEPQTAQVSQPRRNMDPVYLYYCKFCRSLVKATEWTKPGPNSGRCTQAYHGWMRVCEYGTQHGFRCSICGLEVTTNSRPYQGNSCTHGDHQWKQMY